MQNINSIQIPMTKELEEFFNYRYQGQTTKLIDEFLVYLNTKKEAQKLWEYLYENRRDLYIFKQSSEENLKHVYLSSIEFFKEYLKKEFVHKKIAQLKQGDKILDISIFPNGRLYEMNGEVLSDEGEILRVLYGLAREGRIEGIKFI